MTWAYYGGEVTDTQTTPDMFKDARASAVMIGRWQKLLGLRVSGIAAKDGKYGVHLHQGTCDASNFDAAGKHYNVSWNNTTTADDLVRTRLVWLDLNVESDGTPAHSDSVLHPGEAVECSMLYRLCDPRGQTASAMPDPPGLPAVRHRDDVARLIAISGMCLSPSTGSRAFSSYYLTEWNGCGSTSTASNLRDVGESRRATAAKSSLVGCSIRQLADADGR